MLDFNSAAEKEAEQAANASPKPQLKSEASRDNDVPEPEFENEPDGA